MSGAPVGGAQVTGARAAGSRVTGVRLRPRSAARTDGVLPRTIRPVVRQSIAAVLLVIAVAVAGLPVLPAFGTPSAAVVLGAGVLGGAALAALAVWRRLSGTVTLALLVVGHVVLGLLVVAPPWRTSVIAGLRALLAGLVTTWKDVLTIVPPLGDAPGLLLAPWLLGYVGAAGVVLLALRARRLGAYAAAVPVVVLGIAVLLSDRSWLAVPAGVVVGVLGLVAAGLITGTLDLVRPWRIAVLLVPALVIAVAVPSVVAEQRFLLREELEPPFDPAALESPLATFRAYLREPEAVQLEVTIDAGAPLGVTPSSPPPSSSSTDTSTEPAGGAAAVDPADATDPAAGVDRLLRLAVMDTWDGVVWRASASGASGSGSYRRLGGALETAGTPITLEVKVQDYSGVWLPTAGALRDVRPSDGDWRTDVRVNEVNQNAVVVSGVAEGSSYTVLASAVAVPNDEALDGVPAADVELGQVLRVPEVVGVVAREWAGAAATPIEAARALEDRLRNGYYSDGLDGSSPAGHGADRMAALLEAPTMVGNGEQYASVMALMARELGLPSRVVMGFAPQGGVTEDGALTVLGEEVTAWVEIAFEDLGWVPFFPTPDKSRSPDLAPTVTNPDSEPLVSQPRPTQPPPTSAPTREPEDVRATEEPSAEPEEIVASRVPMILAGSFGLLVLLLAPMLVVLAIKAARERRRRRARDPRERTAGAWQELLALTTDLGRTTTATATRREVATGIAGDLVTTLAGSAGAGGAGGSGGSGGAAGAAGPVLLAQRADAAQFSPLPPNEPEVAEAWGAFDATRAALLSRLSAWRRLRVRTTTASLRRRRSRRRR